jgi:hypothetical protein
MGLIFNFQKKGLLKRWDFGTSWELQKIRKTI